MIVILKQGADEEHVRKVVAAIEEAGFAAHVSRGEERTIVGAIGTSPEMRPRLMGMCRGFAFVDRVVAVLKPYKLVSTEARAERSVVRVGEVPVGPGHFTVIAGPCAVESEEQVLAAARAVKSAGAHLLRGGAYKPRTSPYDFQGLGEEGLKLLAAARAETGLPVVTEARRPRHIEKVAEYGDAIQIGARNMQNFDLLTEAGRTGMPVVLKRGLAATVEEWLKAAEYIASVGNLNIILCERGVRTFEHALRFTQDLAIVPLVKELSHLPVIVDPSHASGKRSIVPSVCMAALGVGADGLLVEVHPDPDSALCDAAQQLPPEDFGHLMRRLREVAAVIGLAL
ncbi:MAG: 3-deoxy-7-phosphoheptulonate synthase [Planctomycetota bacterium]|jgi:3-deoxy-7-phosphoheptulonate synthase